MAKDPFFDVPIQSARISQGEVKMPFLYYDSSLVQGFFFTDIDRAEPLLADTGYTVAKMTNGKAMVGVAFFEYRDTSVGAYNECGVAIAVKLAGDKNQFLPELDFIRPPKKRTVGMYITDLPVTTTIACAAGREIWGFPKFITRIPFELTGKGFDCRVLDPKDNQEICALTGKSSFGLKVPGIDLMLYSNLGDSQLRTEIIVKSKSRTSGGSRACLTVGPSRHEMAKRIRDLGLDGAVPALVQTTNRFQSRLYAGTECSRFEQRRQKLATN